MKYRNNPFNIRYTGQKWLGLSGHRNGFCEFDHIDYGIRAFLVIMRSYRKTHHLTTISEIISRYAPAIENNTHRYISFVSNFMKFSSSVVLFNDTLYYHLGSAMSKFESDYYVSRNHIHLVATQFNIKICRL